MTLRSMSLILSVSLSLCSISCTKKETVAGPTIYLPAPEDISSGLQLYLPLAGNAIDSSGHSLNGTTFNTIPVADRLGNPNSALSFNGLTSFVQMGDILDAVFCKPIAQFTVVGWARTVNYGTSYGGGGMMIGKAGGGNAGPYEWVISHVDGAIVAAVFFDTLSSNYVRLDYPMATSVWFQFTMVFDGSQTASARLKLFVNGHDFNEATQRVVGTIGTAPVNSSQHLTIGSGHPAGMPNTPNNLYNGTLAEIRIYNRALTPAQILFLYGTP